MSCCIFFNLSFSLVEFVMCVSLNLRINDNGVILILRMAWQIIYCRMHFLFSGSKEKKGYQLACGQISWSADSLGYILIFVYVAFVETNILLRKYFTRKSHHSDSLLTLLLRYKTHGESGAAWSTKGSRRPSWSAWRGSFHDFKHDVCRVVSFHLRISGYCYGCIWSTDVWEWGFCVATGSIACVLAWSQPTVESSSFFKPADSSIDNSRGVLAWNLRPKVKPRAYQTYEGWLQTILSQWESESRHDAKCPSSQSHLWPIIQKELDVGSMEISIISGKKWGNQESKG